MSGRWGSRSSGLATRQVVVARRRDRSPGRAPRSVQVIVGLVVAIVAALVPAAAWALPVATTTTVTAVPGTVGQVTLQVMVGFPSGTPAAGVVVFSEGPQELARATISTSGYARLVLDRPAPGPHSYTASFLGTPDADPSAGSVDITVVPVTPTNPVSGTASIGSTTFSIAAADSSSITTYAPTTGSITMTSHETVSSDVTGDVPGLGPVTLAVSPAWNRLRAFVGPDSAVSVTALELQFVVHRITVGGVVWSANCVKVATLSTRSGALDPTGVAVTGSGVAPAALQATSCGGRGDLVNAVLGGPVTMAMHLDGSFPPPPPPIPTTTTATVLGSGFVVGDKVPIRATITAASCCPTTPLWVTYSENGVDLRSASSMTNVVDGEVVVSTPGLHTFTVTYRGQSNGVYLAFAVSSTTVTVDVAGPPPGRPVTGQIAIGAHTPAALGAETRLTGAAFDPVTGAIGAGSFWFPQAELSVPAPIVGSAPVRYRLMQLAPTTGQVDSDGSVSFTPTAFALEAREAQIFGSWSNLGACTFSPLPLELSGTADAGGLHLTATSGPFPPVPVNGCGGYASYVNPELAAGATFTFDVTGDFARADATPVGVVSWFSEVAQYNQTLVTASVASGRGPGDPVPSGSVTFRDGAVVVGTVPVDGSGNASLPVTFSSAGSHTVVAVYSGDGSYGVGSATTSVEVTPAPVGYAVGGSVTVGGASLPVGPGSQLVPASPPAAGVSAAGHVRDALASSSAALWFMPTTVTVDAPGYGSVQAEVRLVQYGAMSQAAIGAGGSVEGLAGMFVLQVRKVVTGSGTELPLGCVNLVLLAFDGQLTLSDVSLTSAQAGVGRIPVGQCTGAGAAVITKLASGPTAADLHATF